MQGHGAKARPEDLERRVARWIAQEGLLVGRGPVVVGVSGGADSVALAHILLRLGYPVHLAHLDHGLRPDSGQDAAFVTELARRWGVPITVGREDVRGYAETHGLGLEAAAREVRYTFLFRVANHLQARAVTTGHTTNDQAETVLLHLLRGSGLNGLAGMKPRVFLWDPRIPLERPLLPLRREETRAYCRTLGLPFREDPTNQDVRFTRNRIRHQLLPFLREHFNPRVEDALFRLARIVQAELAVLEPLEETAWHQVVETAQPQALGLNAETLLAQSRGLRARLWRRIALTLRPNREVALEDVDRAEAWLQRLADYLHGRGPRPGLLDWVNGLYLTWEPPQRIWVARWEAELPLAPWPQMPPNVPALDLPLGGRVSLAFGWILEAHPPQPLPPDLDLHRCSPYEAWVDADCLTCPLQVRGRRPGDRFQPLGMAGRSVKLADFMINVKLPRRARDRWPLVVCGEAIVWVPGYRLAHPFRIRPETRRGVYLRLYRREPSE